MERILIVEDEVQLAENLASYLSSGADQFEVRCATTAEQALILLSEEEADILLTDVLLPGMDGIELVRHAVALRPHLRVVVMTAYASPDLRSEALSRGALRFVEKPLDLAELRRLLRELSGAAQGWSGSLRGLDLFDFTQLMVLAKKTSTVRARLGDRTGVLVFRAGQLEHASAGDLAGADAFFEIAAWQGGSFEDVHEVDPEGYPDNVRVSTTHLMMEAARLRDEGGDDRAEGDEEDEGGGDVPPAPEAEAARPVPEVTREAGDARPEEDTPSSQADRNLADRLTEAVGDLGLAGRVWVIGRGGEIIAGTGPAGTSSGEVGELWAVLKHLVEASPRGGLQRLMVEDGEGMVVVAPLDEHRQLLVTAERGARLGVVSLQAARLVERLRG